MYRKYHKINLLYIFLNILIPIIFGNILASELIDGNNKKYLNKSSFNSESTLEVDNSMHNQYVLDTGDVLSFYFEGLDIYSNDYEIDRAGYLKLPEIGFYFARGKTVVEIISDLQRKYKEFIYEPKIKIDISTFRTVKIFISGEINNPGFYNLSDIKEDNKSVSNTTISLEEKKEKISSLKFPKLFHALKVGGGVTNYADLSKIEVIRNNPIKDGGGKKKAEINLLDLIFGGNQEKNIYIFDDDVINIPKSDRVIKEQFLAINKINLNPKYINVYLSGNVIKSGMQSVKKGSSLVQAVASNGGKKIFSGKIEFLRFSNEGDIERRLLRYNSNAKIGSYSNPLLIDGDIINVKRTPIGVLTAALNEISAPILNSLVLVELLGE